MADVIANDGSPVHAAQAMRGLPEHERNRLIDLAGDKVIDLRRRIKPRLVAGTDA